MDFFLSVSTINAGRLTLFDKLFEIIFFISAFLYLLFSFFLFTYKKGSRLSNKIFAGFCLLNALYIMSDLAYIFRHSVYKIFPPYLDVILESTFFLFGPFLYFYTRSMTRQNFVFRRIHLVHLIPFLLDFIYRNYCFFIHSNIAAIMVERGYFISYSEVRLRYVLMEVQVIIYIFASLSIVYRYRSELKEMFSSIEKIKLSWLYLVLGGFLAAHLFHLTKIALTHLNETWRDIFSASTHLGSMLMAAVAVLKGLIQPELFSGIQARASGRKYKKTALSNEELDHYSGVLIDYMESLKPYLNPALTLGDLARALKIPPHTVSQVLSLRLKENFYNFVNRYRIEESKRFLSDPSTQKKTILEILYEAGFNSKAAFNMAFKKHTGMTPTEYVRARQE